MSSFAVRVSKVDQVSHHPNADRLSIIRIGGYDLISAKLDDGSHRYAEGDVVVYVPEAAIVPEFLLRQGFWKEAHEVPQPDGTVLKVPGKGILAGPDGNRVHPLKLRGIFSQGIIFPTKYETVDTEIGSFTGYWIMDEEGGQHQVDVGEDVAEIWGITKYEPPIPPELLGSVFNLHGKTYTYDFDSIQSLTDMFLPGEEVVVTEKIHGFNTQIGYIPGLGSADCFFDGNLYLSSKGLAAQGLAFKNTDDEEEQNVYTKALKQKLEYGFGEHLAVVSARYGANIRLFVEIYGGQDLKYGKNKADTGMALFDVFVGEKFHGGRFLPFNEVIEIAKALGIESVPLLYEGPYFPEDIIVHRDGKDSFTGKHIREGIVIKAKDPENKHAIHDRKIVKWVSPDYSLRKGGTEYQ